MKKNSAIQWFFRWGQRHLLQSAFWRIDVYPVSPTRPVLILVNHSCFYDSLVLFELERKRLLPASVVAVMNAQGLADNKIFNGLGVVPVSTPVKLSEYKHLVTLMNDHTLLLFPQGKEEHLEKRPLTIEKGAAALLSKHPGHGILFISLYYSYGEKRKGQIACRMHYVEAEERPQAPAELQMYIEQNMTAQLDLVKASVIRRELDDYIRL